MSQLHLTSAGIKTFPVANLTPEQIKTLGPLAKLIGVWENVAPPPNTASAGWNVIWVPGPNNNFKMEIIPYAERLEFKPVLIAAANKGPWEGTEDEEIQHIVGLMYTQKISSLCDDQCEDPDLQKPNVIHMETGLFLNVQDYNSDTGTDNQKGLVFNFARLSTVPHGNAVLAIGRFNALPDFTAESIPVVDSEPVPLSPFEEFPVGYLSGVSRPFFSGFAQFTPNTFLQATIEGQTFKSVTEIEMDTENSTGGILNIPFIQGKVTASRMSGSFWIQELADDDSWQLQYSQSIDLLFPGPNVTGQPIQVRWPHTTINTLKKII